jgi:hypothetical protein
MFAPAIDESPPGFPFAAELYVPPAPTVTVYTTPGCKFNAASAEAPPPEDSPETEDL